MNDPQAIVDYAARHTDKHRCGLDTLLKYVSADRRHALIKYVAALIDREGHSYDPLVPPIKTGRRTSIGVE